MSNKLSILAVALAPSLALADPSVSVTAAPSTPATTDQREGCGLTELSSRAGTAAVESATGFNAARLEHSSSLPSPEGTVIGEIKRVWSWCVKPDLLVRVWSACTGAGDSTSCGVFAAPIGAHGKLGAVVMLQVGWTAPTVQRIDASNAPAGWDGSGLKITLASGNGPGVVGLFVHNGTLGFSRSEWKNK